MCAVLPLPLQVAAVLQLSDVAMSANATLPAVPDMLIVPVLSGVGSAAAVLAWRHANEIVLSGVDGAGEDDEDR